MASYSYKIKEGGKRVLDFLSSFNLGKEKIKYFSLHKGSILINDKIADLNSNLNEHDSLTLINDDCLDLIPLKRKINILYEDDYLLIINKPSNILIHSDGNQNLNNTLSNAVAYYYFNKGLNIPVRFCHRLDKDTTGLMIVAKDMLSEAKIKSQIENMNLHRDYIAIAQGNINKNLTINKKIGRDRHVNGKYRISDSGKEAITDIVVLKNFKKYCMLNVFLHTGRTHQIRVHLKAIGHPILGDTLYGDFSPLINRQALHSYHVKFNHPILGNIIDISCPLPYDMKKLTKM